MPTPRGGGGGVLLIFVYEVVRMEGKIQTQKHGFPENFAPKNMGKNCVLVINLMVRDYF